MIQPIQRDRSGTSMCVCLCMKNSKTNKVFSGRGRPLKISLIFSFCQKLYRNYGHTNLFTVS